MRLGPPAGALVVGGRARVAHVDDGDEGLRAAHVEAILRAAVRAPDTRLHALPMLPEGERQALAAWSGAVVDPPTSRR